MFMQCPKKENEGTLKSDYPRRTKYRTYENAVNAAQF